ncbi:heterokaryon incompatibility protein-domain-containing protein [Daldinia decipiens]|uniref:heterokaryon incompatibility protein-domain-containing protein n=1 Tax=Daldinia decipiens TaxID=326647 RepID=UPI0020C53545|nr:heterokaryon incompatibility protein-domain-containing protein [Daldinia decipiens]KAI1660710.1 heterokaryon incompatibility protein-domain-containing protein [Daldinia decipiens]
MTSTTTFQYQPLPARSIRIIKLLPARCPEDPLRCTIEAVCLDYAKARPYEALSYVWGEPARQWPLDCGGAKLLVTKNCHEAMVNLRHKFMSRVLWIDAICINQSNDDEAIEERNGQVKMIGEVYLRAKLVLIWFGRGDASTAVLFRYLPLFNILDRIQDGYPVLENAFYTLIAQHFDITYGFLVKHKRSQLLESMTAILENPWFERVWTIQEVAFGRKCVIICGKSSINWESFCGAYLAKPKLRGASRPSRDLILPRWRLYLSLRGSSLKAIPQTRFEGDGQVRFELELLSEIRNMKATIAHDKVYSLYSVLQAMGIDLPSPDYGKDVVKVFEEATLAYIRSRQNLNVIAITLPPDPSSGSPSWVPDWLTPGRNGSALIWKIRDFDTQYHSTTPILTDNTRDGKLGVMGKAIGKINRRIRCPLILYQALSQSQAYQEVISACLDWHLSLSSLTRYSPGKDPKLVGQALLRPYHANVPNSKLGALYRWVLHDDGTSPPEDKTTLEAIVEKRKLRETWVIFTLDTGYCGTAHHNCQAGDDIVLLKSLNPLVLRPQSKSHEFRIVAPAYCEGAMNGYMTPHNDELEEIILV